MGVDMAIHIAAPATVITHTMGMADTDIGPEWFTRPVITGGTATAFTIGTTTTDKRRAI